MWLNEMQGSRVRFSEGPSCIILTFFMCAVAMHFPHNSCEHFTTICPLHLVEYRLGPSPICLQSTSRDTPSSNRAGQFVRSGLDIERCARETVEIRSACGLRSVLCVRCNYGERELTYVTHSEEGRIHLIRINAQGKESSIGAFTPL